MHGAVVDIMNHECSPVKDRWRNAPFHRGPAVELEAGDGAVAESHQGDIRGGGGFVVAREPVQRGALAAVRVRPEPPCTGCVVPFSCRSHR